MPRGLWTDWNNCNKNHPDDCNSRTKEVAVTSMIIVVVVEEAREEEAREGALEAPEEAAALAEAEVREAAALAVGRAAKAA